MKDGESSMEQAELLVQILAEIRQQNAMLQSTIDTLSMLVSSGTKPEKG